MFEPVNWAAVFVPTQPLLETVLRGSLMYLALFALLRFILKRQAGTVGVTDLLVVVLIADAAQNALAADYRSVPDGILLVGTIIFWNFALEWLGFHYPAIGRFIHPPPLELIRDGKALRRNMRKELITMDELMSQLREQGVSDIADVKTARMEGDGHISVVKKEGETSGKSKRTVT